MADNALSIYNGPQNRGQAFLLSPQQGMLPISILASQAAARQQEKLQQQRLQQQQQKEAIDRISKINISPAQWWDADQERVITEAKEARDYLSAMLAEGKDPTNPLLYSRENAELNRLTQRVGETAKGGVAQKQAYEAFQKTLSGFKDGTIDAVQAEKLLTDYRNAPQEERAKMQLSLRGLWNRAGIAAAVLKSFDKPDSEETIEILKNGAVVKKTVGRFSDKQNEAMRTTLLMDPRFVETVEDEYDQLPENEQQEVNGLQGLLRKRADEHVQLRQQEQIKRTYGVDSAYFNNQRLQLQRENLKLQQEKAKTSTGKTGTGKTTAKERELDDKYQTRAQHVQKMFQGDAKALASLKGGKTPDGRTVVGADIGEARGESLSDFVKGNTSRKIKLIVERETKDAMGKPKKEQEMLLLDPNKPEDMIVASDIMSSKKAEFQAATDKLLPYLSIPSTSEKPDLSAPAVDKYGVLPKVEEKKTKPTNNFGIEL